MTDVENPGLCKRRQKVDSVVFEGKIDVCVLTYPKPIKMDSLMLNVEF